MPSSGSDNTKPTNPTTTLTIIPRTPPKLRNKSIRRPPTTPQTHTVRADRNNIRPACTLTWTIGVRRNDQGKVAECTLPLDFDGVAVLLVQTSRVFQQDPAAVVACAVVVVVESAPGCGGPGVEGVGIIGGGSRGSVDERQNSQKQSNTGLDKMYIVSIAPSRIERHRPT